MKIGELSERTGTQIETIRFYEREGLLPEPSRSTGNYRIYEERHAQRLAFIRHCRSLDMALDEIRALLRFIEAPNENCGEVNTLLDTHINHLAQRILELKVLEKDLKDLRRLCTQEQAAKDCKILCKLTQAAPPLKRNERTGVTRSAVGKTSPARR